MKRDGTDDEITAAWKHVKWGCASVLLSSLIFIGMQVLTLMKGWGLEPKSWPWIIGAGFLGTFFARALLLLDSD